MNTVAVIIDANYILENIYHKTEKQWGNKSKLNEHNNKYFDGFQFIKTYFEKC